MQVYDAGTSDTLSRIVGAIFERNVRVIAGDWRGVQYWIEQEERPEGPTVWVFDPSTMISEELLPLTDFMEAVLGEHILNAVDYADFANWLDVNGKRSIGQAECVPVVPPQFVSGRADPDSRPGSSFSTSAYLLSSAKTFSAMRQLGLKPGDEFPPDFGEVVKGC